MTLTKYGLREWGVSGLIALVVIAASVVLSRLTGSALWYILVVFVSIFWLGIAGFFRNPSRKITAQEDELISPADGTVKDIEIVDFDQAPFNGKALRIGIFLSVFNVHVNRAPLKWRIISKVYREGRYLDARDAGCIKENEAMTLAGMAEASGREFPLGVRQISGAIARRIVCPAEPGDNYDKGTIYGMIKFGSRTEIYLPAGEEWEVKVKIGDKVRAGLTVCAKLKA